MTIVGTSLDPRRPSMWHQPLQREQIHQTENPPHDEHPARVRPYLPASSALLIGTIALLIALILLVALL
jgi:hypothetical protein